MKVTCGNCGKPFEAQRATAKFCGGTCRQRANRRAANKPRPEPPPAAAIPPESLVDAVRRELDAAGRLEHPLGLQALMLAERMCSPFDTGSAVASVSKELRAVMDAALADAPKAADSLDELAHRREKKAESA